MHPYRAVDVDGRTSDARSPRYRFRVLMPGTYAGLRLVKPILVD